MSETQAQTPSQSQADKPLMEIEMGSYNGKPTITIMEGPRDRFALTMGGAKVRKLLTWLDQDPGNMQILRDFAK